MRETGPLIISDILGTDDAAINEAVLKMIDAAIDEINTCCDIGREAAAEGLLGALRARELGKFTDKYKNASTQIPRNSQIVIRDYITACRTQMANLREEREDKLGDFFSR